MNFTKLILLVVTLTLVFVCMHSINTRAQTAEIVQQRFNVFLKIAPEEGSEPIKNGNNLSWRYRIELTVSGTNEETTRQMPLVHLFAGETKSKSALFGDDRIAYEVGIDTSGEKVSAIVEISRDGVPIFVQRLAAWLPPLPIQ